MESGFANKESSTQPKISLADEENKEEKQYVLSPYEVDESLARALTFDYGIITEKCYHIFDNIWLSSLKTASSKEDLERLNIDVVLSVLGEN